MVHALEIVRYVPEVRYNPTSIGVLDEKGCLIQVQKGVIVSQGDGIILEGEKCGDIKAKRNSVQDRISMTSLEGSSLKDGALRKTVTKRKPGQNIAEKRNGVFR